MTDTALSRFCTNCGKGVSGKFCSHCGAAIAAEFVAAPDKASESWFSAALELLKQSPVYAVLAVMVRMLRAPVTIIIQLTEDASYAGQWKLLLTSLGIYFATVGVFIPRLVARLDHKTLDSNKWQGLIFEAETIVAILILAPAMFYVCRALAAHRHTPRAYLKLAVLGFGYWYILFTLLLLAIIVVFVLVALLARAVGWSGSLEGLQTLANAVTEIANLGSAGWLVSALNKNFWRMSWRAAIGVAIGYLLVARLVVFPLVNGVANWVDVAGWLKQLLG